MTSLVDDTALAALAVVANNAMNRERDLAAYRRELGVDPVAEMGGHGWLDLCCGSGRALAAAAGSGRLVGVDLVDHFAFRPAAVEFHVASLADWEPDGVFDVITCVHGLHYLGDKLGLLARVASWLAPDGLFVADFDVASVRGPAPRRVTAALRAAGFDYDGRRKRVRRRGPADVAFPFTYLGADPAAGPNYTGQEAVHGHYAG